MTNSVYLSSTLEDYLEIILTIQEKEGIVRVSEIANSLNVTKSNVTQTINKLKKIGLIIQEDYGPIYLTKTGEEKAVKVRNRHIILKSFLVEILGVEDNIAEKDACLMEHVVSPTTITKLSEFMERTKETGLADNNEAEKQHHVVTIRQRSGEGLKTTGTKITKTKTLNELKIGETGKVLKITAKGMARRRILDMGITPGTELTVKGAAPLGDPIEVLVKNYRLSLRKEEAAEIYLEVF